MPQQEREQKGREESRVLLPPAVALQEHIWVCGCSWGGCAGEEIHPEEKWNMQVMVIRAQLAILS